MTQVPTQPIVFHSFALSGHAHRVALFLSILDLPVERIEVDLAAGEQHTPAFRALNAFGQVPVIVDDDVVVSDSNAILVYLNERYAADPARWMPRDPVGAAQVQRWLSVAAGPLASGPAAARVSVLFKRPAELDAMIERAHALLAIMEVQLSTQDYLAGVSATLADLANYAYVSHAPEGGIYLETYPSVRAWLARIEALPGFVAMQRSPVAERVA